MIKVIKHMIVQAALYEELRLKDVYNEEFKRQINGELKLLYGRIQELEELSRK